MKKTLALLISLIMTLSLLACVFTVPALANEDISLPTEVPLNVRKENDGYYTTTVTGQLADYWDNISDFSIPETATLTNGDDDIAVDIDFKLNYSYKSVTVTFSILADDWEKASLGEYTVTVYWNAYVSNSGSWSDCGDTITLTATKLTVIDSVSFSVTAPEAGASAGELDMTNSDQTSAKAAVSLDEGQHCSLRFANWRMIGEDQTYYPVFTDVFEAGETYLLFVELAPDEGCIFDFENGVAVSVTGGEAQSDTLKPISPFNLDEDGCVYVAVKIAEEESSEEESSESSEDSSEDESEPESSEEETSVDEETSVEEETSAEEESSEPEETSEEESSAVEESSETESEAESSESSRPADYSFVGANELTWNGGELSFTVKRSEHDELTYANFMEIDIDGEPLDKTAYTVEQGSLKVKIKPEALKTLAPGKHTLTVKFTDGTASAALLVKTASEGTTPKPSVDTGMGYAPLIALGVASMAALAVVAFKKR